MSILKANCPSCAAPIEFQKGSTIVLVCPFCRSAVTRTDRGLEDLGKVAEIMDSESPLKLGLSGEFNGSRFELTGRAQLKHELGGFWDEWYATFSNGWVGWVAEAQGKFYLTFYQPTAEGVRIPSFESLQLGEQVHEISSKTPLIVTEKGTATSIAADGEIPYKLIPNEQSNYADLSGKDNAFGTIDYSENPAWAFVGQQVSLAEIGLGDAKSVKREAQIAPAEAMRCPNCAGALELKAPDKTERVTCPFCNSLLDVNQGNLEFLKSLGQELYQFTLPIGAKGSLENFADGAEFQIIGAMRRSVTYEGVKYYWEEYLLYNSHIGFRWLVNSENHWNLVEPVNPAEVTADNSNQAISNNADFNGNTFKLFQTAPATVEDVQGEFYWRVERGETVNSADYVSPPLMLSKEVTPNEINWSLGTYVSSKEVEKALSVSDLPVAFKVAPNQPFKYNSLIRTGLIVLAAFILTAVIVSALTSSPSKKTGTNQEFYLTPLASANSKTQIYTKPFYLEKGSSASLSLSTSLDYEKWSEFDVELVPANESQYTNDPSKLSSAGSTASTTGYKSETLDVGASGNYQIRLEGNWEDWQKPIKLDVDVNQYNGNGWFGTILLILLFAAVPVLLIIYKFSFETRRWSESDYQSNSTNNFVSDIFTGK